MRKELYVILTPFPAKTGPVQPKRVQLEGSLLAGCGSIFVWLLDVRSRCLSETFRRILVLAEIGRLGLVVLDLTTGTTTCAGHHVVFLCQHMGTVFCGRW